MEHIMEKHQSFGKYISIIMRHQRIILDQEFERFGFSSGQYGAFIAVAENEGANQRELCKVMKTTKGTVNKAIKKLEEQGFVHTEIDGEDRRLHCVYLTEKGKDILAEVYQILSQYSYKLVEGLSEEVQEIAYEAIIHMSQNAMAMVDEIREGL